MLRYEQEREKVLMLEADMQKIVYDPVSWIHPQRFSMPVSFSSSRCRSILNDMLFHHYRLTPGILDIGNSNERYLICHWSIIPHAAFMAACQRYRASLAYYGQLVHLDSVTRQFAMLDLVDSNDKYRKKVSLETLWVLAREEIKCLSHYVSQQMRRRLPLLFPDYPRDKSFPVFECKESELLLRMAIQYAKRSL